MENLSRLFIAIAVFFVMVSWEALLPRRSQQIMRKQRWPANLGIALLNMGVMRLTIGGLAFTAALYAEEHGLGLFNYFSIDRTLAAILTLAALDFAIYLQHILMHKWPPLWRLHKVHHSDIEFDATTAVRFHPLEILLSMLYKVAWILVLGADAGAVIAFEVILNAAATFNHSNIAIPEAIDRKLRWLLVTPDMHRIHHSTNSTETDSNYGFSVPWWDRLCRTYTAEPCRPQENMPIGLESYRKQDELGLVNLLKMPFK